MIEITTLKVAPLIVKGLLWIGVALGFPPAMDFVIIQIDHHTMLNPFTRDLFNDLKIIFSALVPVLVAVKIYYDIKKAKKK